MVLQQSADENEQSSIACQVNEELFHCKLSYFLFCAALGAFNPFLPVYFTQLGFGPKEIGLVSFPRPFAGFFGGLICGYVSPRYLARRNALTLSFLIQASLVLVFGMIPSPAFSDKARNCSMTVSSDNDTFKLWSTGNGGQANDKTWLYDQEDIWRNILLFTFVLCIAEMFYAANETLLGAITMATLGQSTYNDCGRQRAWGALGHGIKALVTGAIVTQTMRTILVCENEVIFVNYHILFIVFSLLSTMTLMNTRNLKDEQQAEKDDILKSRSNPAMTYTDVYPYLINLKHGSWLCVIFFRSVFFGVTHAFLYWHLENLGATPLLLGTANFVTTFTEFVMFFFSPWVLDYIGHKNVLYFGLTSYAVRFVVFACIKNPLLVLPAEIVEGITFAFIWSAMVSHLSNAVPPEGIMVVQSLLNSLVTFGIGIGFLISGMLTDWYGAQSMFLIFAVLAAITLILFFLAQTCSSEPTVSPTNQPSTAQPYEEIE